eukprot:4467158-Prymnesium_polylepis.1
MLALLCEGISSASQTLKIGVDSVMWSRCRVVKRRGGAPRKGGAAPPRIVSKQLPSLHARGPSARTRATWKEDAWV